MGLFDFLKKKKRQPGVRTTNTTYIDHLSQTELIRNLCNIPRNKRDEIWQSDFLTNIATAGFQSGTPQIAEGPDGMKYFHLLLPPRDKAFECFVIEQMIEDCLLSEGVGIVINGQKTGADWVFSYGDIFNYAVNKEFYSTKSLFQNGSRGNELLLRNERVRIGQPSNYILPKQARKVIREYLTGFGLNPKICLIEWVDKQSKFDIAFNIVPDMFEKKEYFNAIMDIVKWYFPKHYTIICKKEDAYFERL